MNFLIEGVHRGRAERGGVWEEGNGEKEKGQGKKKEGEGGGGGGHGWKGGGGRDQGKRRGEREEGEGGGGIYRNEILSVDKKFLRLAANAASKKKAALSAVGVRNSVTFCNCVP